MPIGGRDTSDINRPGEYHNGGVWPFVCGFYVAACVAAGRMELARRKLLALTELVKPWHENEAEWGFNEWIKAQTGQPSGRDWQTWSAAMYLYAAECVQQQTTPFFDEIRAGNPVADSVPHPGNAPAVRSALATNWKAIQNW